MKGRTDETGVCKLMETTGKFAKSHLLPRALTPPRHGGIGFPQFGQRQRPSRRFDSWYDTRLVGQAGESILASLDTFGIEELRRLKLVWQSFGPMLRLSTSDHTTIPGTTWGIRRVVFSDAPRMRQFFLSLLWRAAATDRPEFNEICLSENDLKCLRDSVRDGVRALPPNFFPITLTQLSTIGIPHNHTPIAQNKGPMMIAGTTIPAQPMFRFYFDGLMAHIHHSADEVALDRMEPMLVGPKKGTTISTVTWEESWQQLNIRYIVADAEHEFPGVASKADGLPK